MNKTIAIYSAKQGKIKSRVAVPKNAIKTKRTTPCVKCAGKGTIYIANKNGKPWYYIKCNKCGKHYRVE